jgi:uncharacterized damage-inducible protein DinB
VIDADYCCTMARYGAWMNGKIHERCAGLSDAERKRERGAFFGSIHGTLSHLLYGDLAWLSRFTGEPAQMPRLGAELHADFEALHEERRRVDARLLAWSETVTPAWLAEPHVFTSQTDGVTRELPTWVVVVHLFNHATHHRGQLTTLLTQVGLDVGPTDLHKAPGVAVELG